ncbi:helix-turn-helix domain-containing protein [Herbidospora mongoliensis]|uniref:helix-turn-helix domain-containing protein n=1 Tax=Herbidospora mongoliensis TaxID=688067 RepID=UPI000835D095|nr:helix-turn-helix transcriptional regulator [Herbidospora mongoliensis]
MDSVGELLRHWRHRRGLSQLDLAIAADVSARHVSLVETGKSTPSADMILRLADQLDVPLRERNRLLLAAGFAPRYAERPLNREALAAAWEAIERVLHAHEPYPALVIDRGWNILMTNRAIDPFLAEVSPDLLVPPINMVRLGLHPRGLAPHIVNLAQVRSRLRIRIGRQLAAAPEPGLTALYEELLALGSEGVDDPIESEIAIPMVFHFGGRELRLFSTTTTFGTPMDITLDEIAIESYYPTDAETAAYFTRSDEARRRGPAAGTPLEATAAPYPCESGHPAVQAQEPCSSG